MIRIHATALDASHPSSNRVGARSIAAPSFHQRTWPLPPPIQFPKNPPVTLGLFLCPPTCWSWDRSERTSMIWSTKPAAQKLLAPLGSRRFLEWRLQTASEFPSRCRRHTATATIFLVHHRVFARTARPPQPVSRSPLRPMAPPIRARAPLHLWADRRPIF